MPRVTEGKAEFDAPAGEITKDLPVFYNPAMALNRTLEIALVRAMGRKGLRIADVLAGTGIRSIRLLKELPRGTIAHMLVNDVNPAAAKLIWKNLARNELEMPKVTQDTAQHALFDAEEGFDLIDIDPFGSPAPFLDAAIQRLNHQGVLAVTATDTAALAGAAPGACIRKYWAAPVRNAQMHETGMRILVRKCQLSASQHGKALTPLFVHATRHYYRAYLRCARNDAAANATLARHRWLLFCRACLDWRTSSENVGTCCGQAMAAAGPVWTGRLWDAALVDRMQRHAKDADAKRLLDVIAGEAEVDAVGFAPVHGLCKKLKVSAPAFQPVMERIRAAGHTVARTHFAPDGLRTTMPFAELKKLLV